MANALVIGAGGQIGSDLVPALHRRGYKVWVLDLEPVSESRAYPVLAAALADDATWQERWIVGDATDAKEIRRIVADVRPEVVFHLAALLSATGERDPALCWHVNMDSLRAVLDALEATGSHRVLVWPSSIAAFGPLPEVTGGYPDDPLPNEFPMLPATMYGITKVAGELLGSWYDERAHRPDRLGRGVDFRSLRFPGLLNTAHPGGGSSDYANMMYFAAALGQPSVQVFVREDASIPFMHMDDAVRALIELAEADATRLTRCVYNVTAFAPTAAEIAGSIRRQGIALEVTYVPDERQAIVDSWPDAIDDRVARRDWGWQHRLDLDATTRRLIADIRATKAR